MIRFYHLTMQYLANPSLLCVLAIAAGLAVVNVAMAVRERREARRVHEKLAARRYEAPVHRGAAW